MIENDDLKSALDESLKLSDVPFADVDGNANDDVDVNDACEADDNIDEIENTKPSVWRELTKEDGRKLSFRDLLFGDYLAASFFKDNILFVLFVAALVIIYISNRYAAQQEIIDEENLKKELVETKTYALTRCAELTMCTRQSDIERRLKNMGDTTLQTQVQSPFAIHIQK